jgi:hypothetical protein
MLSSAAPSIEVALRGFRRSVFSVLFSQAGS